MHFREGAPAPTVTSVHIYKYIWTRRMQNFRNGSKSALRKSKNYIYEHVFGKISEISKKLYIWTLIQWGGCHVSPLRQRRSPGVLRRSGRVLKALKRTDKCTATCHCTPLDCNRIVRKSEKRQLMILNEGDMALSQFCMVTVSNRKWRCYIL